ncbi:CapA family protein [Fundidesulfovibrio terrae]|uniref:CapA family protein n=1 Tax=Fundidesulfovibrio terrae TaxID=2922866 RepID=UPI001FAF9B55|nr:CapA family protein [Fundidesulfovibrio terrae]
MDHRATLRLFLCGDVMTGRGIDQILPHPGDPTLYEDYVKDAREYVRLAELANGRIERPVDFSSIWGDALAELETATPDFRIINLETSITTSGRYWPGKAVHYRMHPRNIGSLSAARIDCCCLANNHVLDWGREGLRETLETLDAAGLGHAGAGLDDAGASAPAVLDGGPKGRVLVYALGSATSGIPDGWAATPRASGVNLLPDISEKTAHAFTERIGRDRRPGDAVVASIHWGGNWGFAIAPAQVRFARALVDGGVDVVHGHSSHHARGLELYRGRLVIYGCGDFLTDYEGIGGYEEFRADLALMYFADVTLGGSEPVRTRLIPMRMRQLRLERASADEARWLSMILNRAGEPFGTAVTLHDDGAMTVGSGG